LTQRTIQLEPSEAIKDAERCVLGAILVDPECIHEVFDVIQDPITFWSTAHQRIYKAIIDLYEDDQEIDVVAVSNNLSRHRRLEDVGGSYYLASLMDQVATGQRARSHSKIIHGEWIRRRLIRVGQEIMVSASNGDTEADEMIVQAESNILDIGESQASKGFESPKKGMTRLFRQIQRMSQEEVRMTGISTGFDVLDELTGGLQGGDFVVIGGRPSMGKTAFVTNIAAHIAGTLNKKVGFFSLEMDRQQLLLRLLAAEARLDSRKIRNGLIYKDQWKALTDASGKIAEWPIEIDDTAGISVLEMRAKARRLKARGELGLIVVDYLQLVSTRQEKNRTRQDEIATVSRSLKAMAKDLGVPVLGLSQLSRGIEGRGDKRPVLADLRESGAIEQDADVVMFVFREEMYNQEDPRLRGEAEIIIAKQRNGPLGTAELQFSKTQTRFMNRGSGVIGGD